MNQTHNPDLKVSKPLMIHITEAVVRPSRSREKLAGRRDASSSLTPEPNAILLPDDSLTERIKDLLKDSGK
jgi:hypothetical protein